jgi:formyl-CoA transferase/CoA:oxalate CoA-transferase
MFGAFAVAGALFHRERTGKGASIDLSLLDGQVSLLTYLAQYFWTDGKVPGPMGSGHASVVPYQALQTRDGWLIIAVFAEKFWGAFCRAVERPEWERDSRFATNADRVRRRDALIPMVEELFKTRPAKEWLAALHREGVPATPIQRVDQVLSDPQVLLRKMVSSVEHPALGRLPSLGSPIKVDGRMEVPLAPPPALGEQTQEVLSKLLGYHAQRIDDLRAQRAIA